MSDDPRWFEVLALTEARRAAMARDDDVEVVRLVDEYFKVVKSIADDPNAAEDDRAVAKEILEDAERMARAATSDTLRALDRIANDPRADAGVRADAAKFLAKATEMIPPASDKHH